MDYFDKILLFSLKHPAKYIGKKPRKYIIPAKPLTPMHLQSISGNSPNETDSGGGTGRIASNEQVHMYREMSSGALSRATYNKVRQNKYNLRRYNGPNKYKIK